MMVIHTIWLQSQGVYLTITNLSIKIHLTGSKTRGSMAPHKVKMGASMPFCTTCGRCVTLEEIMNDAHKGHYFHPFERAALEAVMRKLADTNKKSLTENDESW
jgi:hypothetical protein